VDYLKEDVEESDYTIQLVLSDIEKEYWIKINKGDVDYGKGKHDSPTATLTTSKDVGLGMLLGLVDANVVSPLGKIIPKGNITHVRYFQGLYEESVEEFVKRY